MGNYRFKLSNIMPNSWLYKLRDMAKSSPNPDAKSTRKNPKQQLQEGSKAQKLHQQSIPRKSYHFTRDLGLNGSVSHTEQRLSGTGYSPVVNSPRQSTNKRRTNARKCKSPRLVSSSVPAGCSCKATLDSVCAKTEQVLLPDTEFSGSESDNSSSVEQPLQLPQTFDQMVSSSTSSSSGLKSGSSDITFDVSKGSLDPEIDLPSISTKPLKFTDMVKNVKLQPVDAEADILHSQLVKEHNPASPSPKPSPCIRGFAMNSSGVKLRINSNSPRISLRQKKPQQGGHRKSSVTASSPSMFGNQRSVLDSIAVVKSSADPRRDFRESMVEMIKENNIRASKDLEELLACYLTLNSDEYHHLIITVFKQIWFDLVNIRLK